MKLKTVLTAVLAASIASPVVMAKEQISAQQKQEFEQVIRNYLLNNPEILLEVSQALQQKQQDETQERARAAISENAKQLLTQELAVAGNAKGDVTLVEFFDYQCVHCKKMKPVVSELLKKNDNIRVVYKELPIFGKSSEIASQAVLAAAMQGKYDAMQSALLSQEKRLDEALVMEMAKSIGLDMAKLKQDMAGDKVKQILADNRKLAEDLQLMGTPAFIIMATPQGQYNAKVEPVFIPGAATEQALQELVDNAAGKAESSKVANKK